MLWFTLIEKKQAQAEQEEDYKALVAENEREMEEMKLAYEEKLRAAREEGGEVRRESWEREIGDLLN